jgi:hypothetical protein
MPFQVSIVLTGATLVNPNIDVFSNPVSNINHGTFVTTVTKTCLTTNSPCTISVPDGTVTVRLRDSGSYCYWDLPTCSSDVCNTCKLGFANILDNQNGTVSIGNLTGSCDNSIDDFRVEWLGPNSLTSTGFTSGKGNQYVYANTHPLIGSSAPLLPPGTYVGRITNVNLNNVKFSSISGIPGHVYSPTLSACSTTVNVSALNCLNGNVPDDFYYQHQKSYITTNPLVTPSPLNTFFQLSNGTKFFVFEFTGYEKWDIIKLTLTGSSRPIPIILEEYKVGSQDNTDNYNPTSFPKSTNRSTVRKIVTLTGLTITSNDSIKIDLTPNTNTNNTSWVFKFGCRENISYEKNCLNTYKNKPYRIRQSSISRPLPGPNDCDAFNVSFNVSGCSSSQNSGWDNSDFKYLIGYSTSQSNITGDNTGLINLSSSFTPSYNQYSVTSTYGNNTNCTQYTGNYTYQKVTGTTSGSNKLIYRFSNQADATTCETQINDAKNTIFPTWDSSNTNKNYYRFLYHSYTSSSSISQLCTDGTSYSTTVQFIAPNAVISSTTVAGAYPYQVEITTPTMTYNQTAFPGTCTSNSWPGWINSVNTFSTGTTIATTTVSSKNRPISSTAAYEWSSATTSPSINSYHNGYLTLSPSYDFYTYPAYSNTTPPTLIPSFSGSPFPTQRYLTDFYDIGNGNGYRQYVFYYRVEATSFSPTYNYKIYGSSISNYNTGPLNLIYDSSLPNPVVDSSFFF